VFGLLVITFMATGIIPTAALVKLMASIALKTSASLGVSPYALKMGIAMAASSSVTSPIQPTCWGWTPAANVLSIF